MLINKLLKRIILFFVRFFYSFHEGSGKKIVVFAHPHSGNDMLRNILHIISGGRRYSLIERKKDQFGNRESITIDYLKLNDHRLNVNDVICYHLPYNSKTRNLGDYFINNNYVCFLSMRDPRDVLLSKYDRIMKRGADPYSDLFNSMENKDERLETLLNNFMNKIGTDSLKTVFKDYFNWKDQNIAVVKYENIMGIAGLNQKSLNDKSIRKSVIQNQNKTIDLIFENLGLKSGFMNRLLVRTIISITAVKGRVGNYKSMSKFQVDLFYKYFPKDLLDQYKNL